MGRAAHGQRPALAARRWPCAAARPGAHQVAASAPPGSHRLDAKPVLRPPLRRTGAGLGRAALGRAHRSGRGREPGQARAGIPRRQARDPVLFADHGAWRRYQGPRRRSPAQRASDAGQLRPAQRTRRARRTSRPGGRVLQLWQRSRSPFLPGARADDSGRGGTTPNRSRQQGVDRGTSALGLAGAARAEAREADGRRARSR